MSVNKRSGDTIKKIGGFGFSALCGLIAAGALTVLFSLIMYALGFSPGTAGALSLIALIAGCFLGGFVCGMIKRRNGLKIGLICALMILAPLIVISLVSGSFTGEELLGRTLLAVLSSCTGSVVGVNLAVRKMR